MENFEFSVSLERIVENFKLEVLTNADRLAEIEIVNSDVNRPGLQICGFFDYFEKTRIQLFGRVEHTYMQGLESEERAKRLDALFSKDIPAVVITRNQDMFEEMRQASEKYKVPVLRTEDNTSRFSSRMVSFLNVELGERITRHGVLVVVYVSSVIVYHVSSCA